MEKRKLLILMGILCLLLILVVPPFMVACAEEAPAPAPTPTPSPKPEPIVLKAVAFLPIKTDTAYFLQVLTDRVNERAKGELVIDYLGGPEVIPMMDQGEAVSKGVVDINLTSLALHTSIVPEGSALYVSQITMAEERERGFNDFIDKLCREKMNLHYLVRGNYLGFYICTNKKVDKPEDLAGLKVRSLRQADRFIEALGGVPVTVATAEAYSALERGVTDAFAGDLMLLDTMKLHEVLKYVIDHPWQTPSVGIVMNLDSWNRLPTHLQDLITDITVEFDSEVPAYNVEREEQARQMLLDGGMEFIKFSPEDAERYVDLAYNAQWGEIEKAVTPENYAKLKELLTK